MECYVFMPEDTPVINQYECALAGAKTFLVNGLINDALTRIHLISEPLAFFGFNRPAIVITFVYLLFLAWLVLYGPGPVSLDALVVRRLERRKSPPPA